MDHPYLEFHPSENNYVLVHHRLHKKYVKMGYREALFLQELAQVQDAHLNIDPDVPALSEQEKKYLTEKFTDWGFIGSIEESAAVEDSGWKHWRQKLAQHDLTSIRFFNVNPERALQKALPLIRTIMHPVVMTFFILMIGIGFGLLLRDVNLADKVDVWSVTARDLIVIYVMIFVTTVLHELSHAITCTYYGGRVTRLGFMLFYLNPAMYCDISDIYLFKRRKHKLVVIFAGIFCQWLLTAVALIVYYSLDYFGVHAAILLYYALANLGISLINTIPLVKLDGYWLLSHALGITNLRTKAFEQLFHLVRFRRVGLSAQQPKKRETWFLNVYGFCVVLFTPLIWLLAMYNIYKLFYEDSRIVCMVLLSAIGALLALHFMKFLRTMMMKSRKV